MHARELIDFVRQVDGAHVRVPDDLDVDALRVTRVSTDEKAAAGDLSWVSVATVRDHPERLASFGGSVLVCPTTAAELAPAHTVVLASPAPKTLFAQLVSRFWSDLAAIAWPEGATAVAPDAKIGERVRLAHGVVVGPRVVIGDDVEVGPNTCLANTTIAARVRIGANCSIGLPGFGYAPDDNGDWIRFPHLGGVRIESEVEIGSNTCIDRGSLGETLIRRGAKIDNLVHIAHNCDIGERAVVIAHAMIGGSTIVGARAWIAPSVAINNRLTVGPGVTVGTGAVVIRDVPDGTTVVGNPAKPLANRSPT